MASQYVCSCKCHRFGAPAGSSPPPVDDPIGTATACSKCRDGHYPSPPWTPPDPNAPRRSFDSSEDTD